MDSIIAFNTANLVAHYSGYRYAMADWGKQAQQVTERTGVSEWAEICRKIRACGYSAIEVWVALVEKCAADAERAAEFARVMQENELTPVALGGPLTNTTAALCQMLHIPAICGGYWGSDRITSVRLMRESGIHYNYENHPERSVEEIRKQIGYGEDGLALAIDVGWLGTQGIDAPDAVRQLGRLIRHVHLKDVAAAGAHSCVPLGTGCVDIPGVIRELKAIGYEGVLSWEDEPEDRNPFDIASEMREYIEREWSGR
jgi:sugar phosphate isomerase/epimerase